MKNSTSPSLKPKTKAVSIGTLAVTVDLAQVHLLQDRVVEQLNVVQRVEHENVVRRLFIGLALCIVKESLDRGDFLPWVKDTGLGARYTQMSYMMRGAREWLAARKVKAADLAAFQCGNFALDLKDSSLRNLVASAEKFVGELSWTDLLRKYGIRDAKELGGARDKGGSTAPAATNPDQLELFAMDEIGGAVQHVESVFLKDNLLQHLRTPEKIRGAVEALRALADKVEAAAKPLLKAK